MSHVSSNVFEKFVIDVHFNLACVLIFLNSCRTQPLLLFEKPESIIWPSLFRRLFPAAVDDLCNLHRESFEAMKQAFDRTTKESRQHNEVNLTEELLDRPHQRTSSLYTHQPHSYHRVHRIYRRHITQKAVRDNEAGDADSPGDSGKATPFTVLLEMIEGRRPLECYANFQSNSISSPNHSSSNASAWSTTLFFKLYSRYLSEFSGAMQMLNKMKTGPASLRKHLKQLQSHPACEFNDISTYLLSPVQRLPRYLLLVRKMIQYSEKIDRFLRKKHTRTIGSPRCTTSAKQGPLKFLEGLPRVSELKKAEEALHTMLLELNEMIDGNVVNLKLVSKTLSGGVSSGAINELSVACSNNCSDNGGVKNTSNTLVGSTTEGDLNSGCRLVHCRLHRHIHLLEKAAEKHFYYLKICLIRFNAFIRLRLYRKGLWKFYSRDLVALYSLNL